MEVVFEKKTTIKPLRLAHFNQIISYLDDREREEWYYGNQKQFNKRHDEIREWVENCIKLLEKK